MTRILTITLIFIFGALSLSSCTQDASSEAPFEVGGTIETPVEGGDDSNTPSGSIY